MIKFTLEHNYRDNDPVSLFSLCHADVIISEKGGVIPHVCAGMII